MYRSQKIHEAIFKLCRGSFYIITIMRRMFYRLGEQYANTHGMDTLINGESVGQVASQTLSKY